MKVCLILPYSGHLPPWTPLFLRSVELNPVVNLFLVYRSDVELLLPKNVIQIQMSLADIEGRVKSKVSGQLDLPHAYKLCDFRPFYALMFPELIAGYDFWGYCDLDLVLGDISNVICESRLRDVDVFSADERMIMGHFTLFRNNPNNNQIAKLIPNYLEKLRAIKHISIDEAGMQEMLTNNPSVRWSRARSLRESQLTIYSGGKMMGRTNGVRGSKHIFFWKDGHTYIEEVDSNCPQEVLYLHFMGLKRGMHWSEYDFSKNYPEFSFSAAGFLPWVFPPTRWHGLKAAARTFAFKSLTAIRELLARIMPDEMRLMIKEFLRGR